MMVCDNGNEERGWSRIVELDPRSGEIVWEYRAPNPSDFFSPGRGTAQRLPNDNVLVGYSSAGEAFEVTRQGRVVWRFLSPQLNRAGNRLAIRIKRYETDLVESILRRVGAPER